MRRRKYIAAMGSLAAGGAAMMGTGALDSIRTERGMAIDIAGDDAAYLGILPNEDSQYVEFNNGQVKINFASNQNGGSGVNTDGTTAARPAYTLKNQGSETVYVEIGNPLKNNDITSSQPNPTFDGGGTKTVPKGVDVQFIACNDVFLDPTSSGVGSSSGSGDAALIDRNEGPDYASADFADPVDPANIYSKLNSNYKGGKYDNLNDSDSDVDAGYVELGPGQGVPVIVRIVVNSRYYDVGGPNTVKELYDGQFLAVEAYTDKDALTLDQSIPLPNGSSGGSGGSGSP